MNTYFLQDNTPRRSAFSCFAMLAVASVCSGALRAAEPVSFDRPGIGFGTEVLSAGQFSWEQGLPDFSRDRPEQGLILAYSANTLLRFGLGSALELQLGSNLLNQQRGQVHQSGAGDSSLALKLSLPAIVPGIDWALRATYQHPSGQTPFRAESSSRSLAASAAYQLNAGRSLAFFLERTNSAQENSWSVSPSYTFYSDEAVSAYTELGWSDDPTVGTTAGGGAVWRLNRHWQFDLWLLRGLSNSAADWQTGFGISWTPD